MPNGRIRFWYNGELDPTSWYDLNDNLSFLKNVFVDKIQIEETMTKEQFKILHPELAKEI